jgi:hypothetical protein
LVPPDDNDHNSGLKARDAKLAALMALIEDLERRAAGHECEKRRGLKLPPATAPAWRVPEAIAAKRAADAEL